MNRRRFLAAATGVAAVAAGGPLLAACSSGPKNSPSQGGAAHGSDLKKVLPTFKAASGIKPDVSTAMGYNGYWTFPANPTASVSGVPGKGGTYSALTPLWASIPPGTDKNPYYQAVNKALGVTIDFQVADGNSYLDKLTAVLASSDVPDWVSIMGWTIPNRMGELVASRFADLTPHLAGDKISKYPNLAALPTASWQYSVFNGKLYGLPFPNVGAGNNPIYMRKDIFEDLGIKDVAPKNADDFLALLKEVNAPKKKRWAADDLWGAAQSIFGVLPSGAGISWKKDGAKLVKVIETEEYLEALDWTRKVFKSGVVHPDAVAGKSGDSKTRFTSGAELVYTDGVGGWSEQAPVQAKSNPKFHMQPIPWFAADGSAPQLWKAQPAWAWSFLNKKLKPAQIEELLAVANWFSAPFGSTEYLLKNFGVEGTDFSRVKGAPTLNDTGYKYVTASPPGAFLSLPAPFFSSPGMEQLVKDYTAFINASEDISKEPLFYGVQLQEPSQYASLDSPFVDLQTDYCRGRKSLKDVKSAISNWRSQGGDRLRDWYKKQLDELGTNGSTS